MLAEHVALAREAARTALTETRRTVLGIGPALLEGRSLQEAIALEVAWAKSTAGLDAKLIVAGEQVPLDPEIAHQVFRIAQEALTNIVAHAAASSARIGLVFGSDAVVLLVEDDGRGFDTDRVRWANGGELGLRGIVARARRFGGVAQFESTPGWGTRIRVQLPYASVDAAVERVERLSVLVVEDQPLIMAGIVALLGLAEPSVQVVGEIGRAREVLDAYRMLKPDVVLLALRMAENDGVELTKRLRAEDSEAAVVALAGSRDDELVPRALRAGVRGCLTTDVDGPELARAVLAAAHGDAMISERILATFSDSHDAPEMRLTERETEVRVLLERGLPDKQIAGELGIAPKTVEKHVAAILRKAGVRNRTALVAQSRGAH
jgi:DNA-binding NarL/FixJ family response regulator